MNVLLHKPMMRTVFVAWALAVLATAAAAQSSVLPPPAAAQQAEGVLVLVGDLLFRIPPGLSVKALPVNFGDPYFNTTYKPGDRDYIPPETFAKAPYRSDIIIIDLAQVPPWKDAFGSNLVVSSRTSPPFLDPCKFQNLGVNEKDWDERKIIDPKNPAFYFLPRRKDDNENFLRGIVGRQSGAPIFGKNIRFLTLIEFSPRAPKDYILSRSYRTSPDISKMASVRITTYDYDLKGRSIFDAAQQLESMLKSMRVKTYEGLNLWPYELGECPASTPQ